jgi:Rrf2 family transcriptional regulator, iron-sulfur cluster assembly transcription factor
MFNYSKLAQAGISAVSYLAGIADEARLAGSAEIAEARELSHQLIAKVLTLLSRFGIVEGTRGPSGGYRLARPAAEITLFDVVRVFEDPDERVMCPFGPNWCGHGSPCPLHDKFIEMHQSAIDRLTAETFAQFEKADGLLQKKIEPQMDADGRR